MTLLLSKIVLQRALRGAEVTRQLLEHGVGLPLCAQLYTTANAAAVAAAN